MVKPTKAIACPSKIKQLAEENERLRCELDKLGEPLKTFTGQKIAMIIMFVLLILCGFIIYSKYKEQEYQLQRCNKTYATRIYFLKKTLRQRHRQSLYVEKENSLRLNYNYTLAYSQLQQTKLLQLSQAQRLKQKCLEEKQKIRGELNLCQKQIQTLKITNQEQLHKLQKKHREFLDAVLLTSRSTRKDLEAALQECRTAQAEAERAKQVNRWGFLCF